jgi:hypothetical protein
VLVWQLNGKLKISIRINNNNNNSNNNNTSCMSNEWGSRGMHIGYCWESQKERHHWEDQDVDGCTILKWMLER